MIQHAIPPLELFGLTSTVRRDDRSLAVIVEGSADLPSIDPLAAHLRALHQESLRVSAAEVVVDFRALEFLSSSCLKAFVEWISAILEEPLDRRYRVRFVANRELRWQRRSLESLRCFASDLVSVEE